jgi:CheY-like chemotaxis protein
MTTILLIDDEPVILSNTAQMLEFEGYDVIVSLNGPEAIETLNQRAIDLVLCDMLMKPMSGFEILHAIRQNGESSGIPFVFVTAVAWSEEEAEVEGVAAYLRKPFTIDALLAIVREQIGTPS